MSLAEKSVCPPPPQVSGAQQTTAGRNYRDGSKAVYSCPDGFQIAGTKEITCTGGRWPSPPQCVGQYWHKLLFQHFVRNICGTKSQPSSAGGCCYWPKIVINRELQESSRTQVAEKGANNCSLFIYTAFSELVCTIFSPSRAVCWFSYLLYCIRESQFWLGALNNVLHSVNYLLRSYSCNIDCLALLFICVVCAFQKNHVCHQNL